MTENEGKHWGLTTAIWAIVAVIVIFAAFKGCAKMGDNKAELAAVIQKLNGRQEVLIADVDKNTTAVGRIDRETSRNSQGLSDLHELSAANFHRYNHDLYAPRAGYYPPAGARDGRCNGDNAEFTERQFFTPTGSVVTKVSRC